MAVSSGDAAVATEIATPDAASLLRSVVDNAGLLDVTGFVLRYVDEVGAVGPDGTWQAAVEVSWQFGSDDPGPASTETTVLFHPSGDRVEIAGIGGPGARTPVWLTGPVEVERSSGVLVLAAAGSAGADRVLERAVAALPIVRAVLPTYDGPLVVEAPASEQQLESALGAEPGSYAAVAAVTATVDGSIRDDAPIHVFLNPQVYDALDPIGAQVVISHEATHVATEAPLHALPVWLLEGFADYVALRDVDLPLTTTAGQIAAEVRDDGLPDALPDQTDFATGSVDFGAAYEAAWLACVVVAGRAGQRGLVDVYDQVSDGVPVGRALREAAGLSVSQLTVAWRARLRELAR